MTVGELINELKNYPQDSKLGKVCLSDDTGGKDSEMTIEDWSSAKVKDTNGIETNEVVVLVCFN